MSDISVDSRDSIVQSRWFSRALSPSPDSPRLTVVLCLVQQEQVDGAKAGRLLPERVDPRLTLSGGVLLVISDCCGGEGVDVGQIRARLEGREAAPP